MADGDLHSRLVGWLKILLPLAALAVLSTLFLVARTIDPTAAIPFAEVDVEDRVREPRMTVPEYAGTTSDGTAITLSAAEARPGSGEGGALARAVNGRMLTPDGAETRLAAALAALEGEAGLLRLSGGVVIETSTGYRLTTEALDLRTDRTGLTAPGAVQGQAPAGTLQAGSMDLVRAVGAGATADKGGYTLLFKGGVKLLYQPPIASAP